MLAFGVLEEDKDGCDCDTADGEVDPETPSPGDPYLYQYKFANSIRENTYCQSKHLLGLAR
jgi:hypothetical protein